MSASTSRYRRGHPFLYNGVTPTSPVVRYGPRHHAPPDAATEAGNVRGFFNWTFEAQSHGPTTRCLRFAPTGYPADTQDSLPAAWLRSAGWDLHSLGLTRKGFRDVSVSHLILLYRAGLAQTPFHFLSFANSSATLENSSLGKCFERTPLLVNMLVMVDDVRRQKFIWEIPG